MTAFHARLQMIMASALVAVCSMAFVAGVASVWHFAGPLAAVVLIALWVYVQRGWLLLGLYLLFDAGFFIKTRHVCLTPLMRDLYERAERDRTILHRPTPQRTWRDSASVGTLILNPLAPVALMAGRFLLHQPRDEDVVESLKNSIGPTIRMAHLPPILENFLGPLGRGAPGY